MLFAEMMIPAACLTAVVSVLRKGLKIGKDCVSGNESDINGTPPWETLDMNILPHDRDTRPNLSILTSFYSVIGHLRTPLKWRTSSKVCRNAFVNHRLAISVCQKEALQMH